MKAVVPDKAPEVTSLQGAEVQAVYPLRQVKQVAGPGAKFLPHAIQALLANTSVPIFLPPGSYILLVYRDQNSGAWSVLTGLPGEFELHGTSAQQRCMLTGIRAGSSQKTVLKAARSAKRGPAEPVSEVVSNMKKRLN